ncbi:MAG: hypothetical protein ACK52I_29015 [Pseudomonadota bacterium]|jgi:hypothetical protein
MKTYNYLRKFPVSIHNDSLDKRDYVEATEMNEAVKMLVITNTELLHALRQIRFIATDYDLRTRLQDVLRAIHLSADQALKLLGEEGIDK